MPRILILATTTGYQLRSFGEAADALGIELMFATDRCHTLDDPWRDAAVAVRFHEEQASLAAIVAAARTRPLDGILAVGDRPVVLAALAAAALGLPGNRPDAARISSDKRLARHCFADAGLPQPAFVPLTVDDGAAAARRAASGLRYPLVIKPVALSGSRGVMRADDPDALAGAFARIGRLLARPEIRAARSGTEHDLLIEEFIPGAEFAVEGMLHQGRFTALAIFDKPDPLDGPWFEETIYVTPSRATPAVQAEILATVARAAAAIGLGHGPVHAECRVNGGGTYILEVAARPIGGLCSRVLRLETPDSHGAQPLEHVLLRLAIGRQMVADVRREAAAAAVMMVPIPRRGIYKSVSGEEEARRVPYVTDVRMTAKTDQLLEPLPEGGSYLGFIFARAPQPVLAEAAVREAHRRLRILVQPAIAVHGAAGA